MKNNTENKNAETAVFGAGCFWGVEAAFAKIKGVESVVSGYAGGSTEHPTYEEVYSGITGHAEVVRIEYNPQIISYGGLLAVFFSLHDPTTPNHQGADSGTQYRSIILFTNEKQEKAAKDFVRKLSAEKIFANPITTEIKPLAQFFPAEGHHQKYFEKNPNQAYCQINIPPKIEKLRKKFGEMVE